MGIMRLQVFAVIVLYVQTDLQCQRILINRNLRRDKRSALRRLVWKSRIMPLLLIIQVTASLNIRFIVS